MSLETILTALFWTLSDTKPGQIFQVWADLLLIQLDKSFSISVVESLADLIEGAMVVLAAAVGRLEVCLHHAAYVYPYPPLFTKLDSTHNCMMKFKQTFLGEKFQRFQEK